MQTNLQMFSAPAVSYRPEISELLTKRPHDSAKDIIKATGTIKVGGYNRIRAAERVRNTFIGHEGEYNHFPKRPRRCI
jgi:hypothetical protein